MDLGKLRQTFSLSLYSFLAIPILPSFFLLVGKICGDVHSKGFVMFALWFGFGETLDFTLHLSFVSLAFVSGFFRNLEETRFSN